MENVRNCEKHKRVCETFCFQCKKIDKPMCPVCLCEHNAEVHSVKNAHITLVIQQGQEEIKQCLTQTAEKQQKIKTLTEQVEAARKEKDEVLGKMSDKLTQLETYCKEQRAKGEGSDKTILASLETILAQMKAWDEKLHTREAVPARLAPRVEELLGKQSYWDAYDEVYGALAKEVQLNEQEVATMFEECGKTRGEFKKQLTQVEAVSLTESDGKFKEQSEALERELAHLKSILPL